MKRATRATPAGILDRLEPFPTAKEMEQMRQWQEINYRWQRECFKRWIALPEVPSTNPSRELGNRSPSIHGDVSGEIPTE